MDRSLGFIAGVGIGAAAMYFLDPDRGRTRRSDVTQKVVKFEREKLHMMSAKARHARNRMVGMWHQAASRFAPDDVSDEALGARVRAAMGRAVTHPGAVHIECNKGRVVLRGDILADEVESLIQCVSAVKGVQGVANDLTMHQTPGTVPSLQGEGRLHFESARGMRPSAAIAAGLAGAGLAAYGVTRIRANRNDEAVHEFHAA